MKILIFNPYHKDITQKIVDAIMEFSTCQIVNAADHPSFEIAFSSCLNGETIVVFFIREEKDISFLEYLHPKFFDIKLIVNHPDHGDKFQARIIKLCPRIITVTHECSQLLPYAVHGIVKQKSTDIPKLQ